MILFCEDCGQKNDLAPAAFAQGRAVFICSACGYNNSYALAGAPSTNLKNKSIPFLEDLQSVPGIIGVFLYHETKGLVGEKMPSVLRRNDIETLGAGLAFSYNCGSKSYEDMDQMTVLISDKFFTVFNVESQLYAVIVTPEPELPEKVGQLIEGFRRERL